MARRRRLVAETTTVGGHKAPTVVRKTARRPSQATSVSRKPSTPSATSPSEDKASPAPSEAPSEKAPTATRRKRKKKED